MTQPWALEHQTGVTYLLINDTGAEVRDVEITARRVQLDGRGKDFVRRVASVEDGEAVIVKLRRVFGGTDPELHITWAGASDRHAWGIRLSDYL